ncbi:MAG TPA: hypothetical protein VLA00_15895 [Xanthobacteraceae bacterium]|nr:hypothetical protein [Xanthobacteraceae bacterium]
MSHDAAAYVKMKYLMARMEQLGVRNVVNVVETLVTAMEASANAIAAEEAGDYTASANYGDQALDGSLGLVRQLAGPELDRIMLAALLDVPQDSPDARSSSLLMAEVERIKAATVSAVATDVERIAARRALSFLLSALDGMTLCNFLAACAGSLLKVNVGDTSGEGWIAKFPKRPGSRRTGAGEVRVSEGYSATLLEAYYSAGFFGKSIGVCLDSGAEKLGVTSAALINFRQGERGLLELCRKKKLKGREDAKARRSYLPFANRSANEENPFVGGRLRGSHKATVK